MWPFSRGKKETPSIPTITVSRALEQLAAAGVHIRPGITPDDVLFSLGGTMDSPVDWVDLLCVIGGNVERGQFEIISDDLWHFDAECVEDHGDYVRVLERFVRLTKGALPATNLRDHVDIENGTAWVEFVLDGQTIHWDLEVSDDWVDAGLYSRLQETVSARSDGKKFFIVALGQDSLISFGDETLKQNLSQLSGLKFQWE